MLRLTISGGHGRFSGLVVSLTKFPRKTNVNGGTSLPHGSWVSAVVPSALMLWVRDEAEDRGHGRVWESRLVTRGGQETEMENVHTRGLSPCLLFIQSVIQQAVGWCHPHSEQVTLTTTTLTDPLWKCPHRHS